MSEYRSDGNGSTHECKALHRMKKSFAFRVDTQHPMQTGWPLLCCALRVPAEAQQPGKIFRIGFLDPSTASGSAVLVEAFRQELSKLGWIEGKNITIEYRFAEQKHERLPELAAELVRLKVDLIVVAGTPRRWRPRKQLLPSPS